MNTPLLPLRFVLMLSIVFFLCEGTARPAEDGPELKIMTFNIRFGTADDKENRWELRRAMLIDVVKKYAPDILCVQEALRFQLDEIRAALPQYAESGKGRDDGRTAGEYSAILYQSTRFRLEQAETFWFSDTPDIPGSKTWGNSITRICSWIKVNDGTTGVTFRLFNLHLDHISQPSREKSALALVDKIQAEENSDPIIITGDFNASEQNSVIRFLKADTLLFERANPRTFVDTFRFIHPHDSTAGTFHAFDGGTSGDKIDYILVEAATIVKYAEIVRDNNNGRYPSDHFPVVATIILPTTKGE